MIWNRLLLFIFLLLLFSCQSPAGNDNLRIKPAGEVRILQEALSRKHKKLKNFNFEPRSPLIARVKPIPKFLLKTLRTWNKKKNLFNYALSKNQMNLMKKYLDMLPDKIQRVLKDRLVAIYFVKKFVGGGFTNWLVDEKNQIYCYIVLPARLISVDLDQWLSYKESLHFVDGEKERYNIQIHTGKGLKAVYYGLYHELAHVIDYSLNVTPYLWRELQYLNRGKQNKRDKIQETEFTKGIWKSLYNPTRENNFYYRKYFILTGSGHYLGLKFNEAVQVYRELAATSFVSLYGSKSWAEDFAEFFTFYHLTQILKKPYYYQVKRNNRIIYRLRPMDSPRVKARFKTMKQFYSGL